MWHLNWNPFKFHVAFTAPKKKRIAININRNVFCGSSSRFMLCANVMTIPSFRNRARKIQQYSNCPLVQPINALNCYPEAFIWFNHSIKMVTKTSTGTCPQHTLLKRDSFDKTFFSFAQLFFPKLMYIISIVSFNFRSWGRHFTDMTTILAWM